MTYDSLFGRPPGPPPPPPRPMPARRVSVPSIVAIVLALVGATLVFLPQTRLVGLGVAVVLTVPVALIMRRDQGTPWFWLATSALAILGVAFLAGFVVTLVSGAPVRSVPGTPAAGLSTPPPAAPEMSAPIELSPPAEAVAPAAPAPVAGSGHAPAAPGPAAPGPAKSGGSSGSSAGSSSGADDNSSSRERKNADDDEDDDDDDWDPTAPPPRVGTRCEVGSYHPNPDGSMMICGQPDGRGGFTWRRVEQGDGGWGRWGWGG